MVDPCVTPSGHTIDGKAMNEWICKLVCSKYIAEKKKDAWNPKLKCGRKVSNIVVKLLVDNIGVFEK